MKFLFVFSAFFIFSAVSPVSYLYAQDAPPVDIVEDDSPSDESVEDDSSAEEGVDDEDVSNTEEDDSSDISFNTDGKTEEEIAAIKKSLGMVKEAKVASKSVEEDEPVMTLEELQEYIYSLPAAKDAIDIPISEEASWRKIYDIYSRQIAYRESAKKLRASLEARQESFAEPRTEIIAKYKENLKKVYASERAAYEENLEDEKKEKKKKKKTSGNKKSSGSVKEKMTSAKKVPDDGKDKKSVGSPKDKQGKPKEDVKLEEQDIPPKEGDVADRKVITSEDAPDFDPSNL